MGSVKHLRKLYEKPKKLWEANRLEEERKLCAEYGLRSMHELWREKTILRKVRRNARQLLSRTDANSEERTKKLLDRVASFLIRGQSTLDAILALTTKDMLERRLQTIVVRRGLANSMLQSRQFITHGHIAVKGRKATSPSYIVTFGDEQEVSWYGAPLIASKPEAATVEEAKPEQAQEKTEVVANA